MASTSRGMSSLLGGNNVPRPKLGFHTAHGEHIRIMKNGKVAKRVESFCKGLAFSDRSIDVDEIVCLKFAEMSTNWSGVLRFGVTNTDPATLANGLPRFACPDLTSKEGNWAKALAERYCQEGSLLHFYVRDNGELYYGINGVQKGLFLSGINTRSPLWVLVDIYGNSTSLEFLDPADVPPLRRHPRVGEKRSITSQPAVSGINSIVTAPATSVAHPISHNRGAESHFTANNHDFPNLVGPFDPATSALLAREISERLSLSAENNTNAWNSVIAGSGTAASERVNNWVSRPAPVSSPKYFAGVPFRALCLHAVHGKNVTLSPDRTGAFRTETEYVNGYVFTQRPINLKEKVVIQIINIVPEYQGGLAFGLTSCDPIHLRPDQLPDDPDLLLDRAEYWVVAKDVASSPKTLDELAFYINDEGQVNFTRNNGASRIIMHVDQTQKLWMFFDIYGTTQQIRILGCTELSSQPSTSCRRLSAPFLPPHTMSLPSMTSSPTEATTSTSSQQPQLRVNLPTVPSAGLNSKQILRSLSPTQRPPLPPPRPPQLPARPASVAGAPRSAAAVAPPSQRKMSATPRVEMQDNQEERECAVCMTEEINAVLYTCGHMCMCYECAILTWEKKGECPMCRTLIKDVIKAFRK